MVIMQKSFSRLNLLRQSYLSPFKKGISQWLQLDVANLTLSVPYYDYLRGQVFIDDIKTVYEECPDSFNLASLLSLLHDDFLYHTKKGSRNHQQTAHYLSYGQKQYLAYQTVTKREKQTLKRVNEHTFVMSFEEEEEIEEKEDRDLAEITIRLKESKIQRTEILLYDVSPYMNDQVITVEDMLVIVYLDFIEKVKQEGNNDKVMKSILRGLEFYKTS